MKIIINTTNLRKGGALQVALSVISELKAFSENDYYIFLSPAFQGLLNQQDYPENIKFYELNYPSRFIAFSSVIKSLKQLENSIKPDSVFTVFGPTYWVPKAKHIMGFANGMLLYKDLPYFNQISILEKIKWDILGVYHRFLLKYNTDIYLVETEDVKIRLAKFLSISADCIKVVSNTYHEVFNKEVSDLGLLPHKPANEFWLLTVSAFYPHKNLEVINKLIPALSDLPVKFKFILTLPENTFKEKFDITSDRIINIGPVDINECPYLYYQADALFLPTLVESFTASYVEAMKMMRPVLTSDFSFSRSICRDAAIYFNPFDPEDIVHSLLKISQDKALYNNLVKNGLKRLLDFPTPSIRARTYVNFCMQSALDNMQAPLIND